MRYEVYQNKKNTWQWRIVLDDGTKIATSNRPHVHPGECHREIIKVQHLTGVRDVKQIRP